MAKKKPNKPAKSRPAKPKPPGKKPGPVITEGDRRFIEQYLVDGNATQAAIRAGFSEKSAQSIGYQLLHKTIVAEEINRRQAVITAKLGIDAERVRREIAKIAFANIGDFEQCAGHAPKSLTDIAPEDAAAVQEISETRYGRKLKLHSKTKALELLGKHLRLFYDPSDALLALLAALPHDVGTTVSELIAGHRATPEPGQSPPAPGGQPAPVGDDEGQPPRLPD